jgi:hypothetical protein
MKGVSLGDDTMPLYLLERILQCPLERRLVGPNLVVKRKVPAFARK